MKKILIFLCLISAIYGGDDDRVDLNQLIIYPQGIPISNYNGIGFSDIAGCNVSDIARSNPASIYHIPNIAVGLSYQYFIPTEIYTETDMGNAKSWPPLTFGFVYPLNDFRVGVAYHQKYTAYVDFRGVELTTIEEPGGTGEYIETYHETMIHSPAILFNYTFNQLPSGSKLSVGLQTSWDFLKIKNKFGPTTGQLDGNCFNWHAGLVYEYNQYIKLGCVYETKTKLEGEFNYNRELVYVSETKPTFYMRFPDKLAFGYSSNPMDALKLSGTFTVVFWENINEDYRDILEISMGGIYNFSSLFAASLGFFTTDLKSKDSEYYYINRVYDASYIIGGTKFHYKNADVRIEVFDSHLFSASTRKQTLLKIGLDISFEK